MSKTVSLFSALLCTFIWGTTFIAQDTGMDDIGPFTFYAVRFFVGFLVVAPLAFIFERKNISKSVQRNQKEFTKLDVSTETVIKRLDGALKDVQNLQTWVNVLGNKLEKGAESLEEE